ncbi:MAG: phosphoenolpyruvate synthase [Thiotrichales bacterium 32-46-8]|nr:MAG: phosphoenolpyruvate synthase [Thiotrichales bacterium 32-46-8]OYY24624.1 MAG: phosphoenolpyruvate synthase [Thiotrichales bacterium 35-46-9]OZA18661.1 MAG: phosphoenolpyruvate synthase [Thiotrichales bacterium 17-46-47]OZA96937.1 MAG: phosphoenolpyruvate synthase [Thiotrichales bacterium 34-46-19]UCG18396.1 MAG: phosphoenolpyruvate synthase [Thiotrichales bacterium]
MRYIKTFAQIRLTDLALVGGKNASLGEMFSELVPQGLRIPNGFAITADGYWAYLAYNGLTDKIQALLATLDPKNLTQLQQVGQTIRNWIINGQMPPELKAEITQAYQALETEYRPMIEVAIRSSATAEDLPGASFAGQQETYLNIAGDRHIVHTTKRVFASLFTNRAISYRADKGFAHDKVALSVTVQKMVRADKGVSGVMFTLDTESGFNDVVLINAAYGLGENVVQGAVNPDEYLVHKPTLLAGHAPILKRQLGDKALRMVYTDDAIAGNSTKNIKVMRKERQSFALTDDEVLSLARQSLLIEQHYSQHHGRHMPMDIEWAKDGIDGQLYILQARPETVHAEKITAAMSERYQLGDTSGVEILATGRSIGAKIATGRAKVIESAAQIDRIEPGDVLVTDMTDPDWEPIMKIASAIVTNRGGRTCHAAIIARELGIPAIVGTQNATLSIHDDEPVTVSCAQGESGVVYKGEIPFIINKEHFPDSIDTRTKLMVNVANPELAFIHASMPVAGVGLARLEFIINHAIRVHPRALLEYDTLSKKLQKQIDEIIAGYASPRDFFIERLAEGVGAIAAAFYPRQVIVRLSDFKSNEYAALIGGAQFEPHEENPMIGLRGAARYFDPRFRESFALECAALKKVREAMGLHNVSLMIPFVRTVPEAQLTLGLMERYGLVRGENDLKVYLMCEIPANAILADQFLPLFDGFSIGSNDLTQLSLGVDRDSGLLTGYDERNPAVTALMDMAIDACHRHGKYVGICGQAPSDFPEITQHLVEKGITSLSLNPDSVANMLKVVETTEERLAK